jgi:tetratricopeptide (TPR) repeat protein
LLTARIEQVLECNRVAGDPMIGPWTKRESYGDLLMAEVLTLLKRLSTGVTLSGPLLPELTEVIGIIPCHASIKIIGRGKKTGQITSRNLSPFEIGQLKLSREFWPLDDRGIEIDHVVKGFSCGPEFLAIFERLAAEFPNVPEYREGLAQNYQCGVLPVVVAELLSDVDTAYCKELAIRERLAAEFPDLPEYREELAECLCRRGIRVTRCREDAEALPALRQSIAIRETLVSDFPHLIEYRKSLAESYMHLGFALLTAGKHAESDSAYRRGLEVMQQRADKFPHEPEHRYDFAKCLIRLGPRYFSLSKPAEVEFLRLRTEMILKGLAADFPRVPKYRQELHDLYTEQARTLAVRKQWSEAEKQLRQALSIAQRLAADFPENPNHRIDVGRDQCFLGQVYFAREEFAVSLDWLAQAIATLVRVHRQPAGKDRAAEYLRDTHLFRATVLDDLQRYSESEPDWKMAIELTTGTRRSELRIRLFLSQIRAGKLDQVTAEMDAWATRAPFHHVLYKGSRVFAFAHAQSKEERFALRAIELLHQAVFRGFKDVEQIKTNMDLDSLHDRDDFQHFLADLEKKYPSQPTRRPSRTMQKRPS